MIHDDHADHDYAHDHDGADDSAVHGHDDAGDDVGVPVESRAKLGGGSDDTSSATLPSHSKIIVIIFRLIIIIFRLMIIVMRIRMKVSCT